MTLTELTPTALPLVRADEVRIGAYLADPVNLRLYCVMDLRRAIREGRSVRLAMLEDALTEEIEPWDFGRVAGLRLLQHAANF